MTNADITLTPDDMNRDALLEKGFTPEEIDLILAHQTDHDDDERGESSPSDYR